MFKLLREWRRIPSAVVMADRAGGRFLALSALTGVFVGVGAWLLVETLHAVEALTGFIASHNLWWVVVTIPAGLFISWWIAHRIAPEVAGDGVPEATASLIIRGGHIRGRVAPLKIAATSITLGAGGSGGREGPIVLIGASIGSKIAQVFNLGEDQVRSLVAAGAGAGIGAAFNAPIAGMLFALEVILSSFAVRHMSSVVVASVAAAITSRTLVGESLALNTSAYRMGDSRELILYVGLALVCVLAAVLFLRLLDRLEGVVAKHHRATSWRRPVILGLATAALVIAEPLLLGQETVRLFGTGQEVTNDLLQSASVAMGAPERLADMWWVLGLVAVAKIFATAFTLSSGASAGAFMPALFIGAMLGSAFAKLVAPMWAISPIHTGAFAVVGMAAMFSAMGRAPLTAVLLIFEVTGTREYGLILPLMLAAIVATFLAELFHHESVYTMPLRRRGIAPLRSGEVDLMDTVAVGDVMATPRVVARPHTPAEELRAEFARHRTHGAPVLDEEETLVGVVTSSDLAGDGSGTRITDVMTPRPATVTPDTPVSQAMERMAALGVGRLPVVAVDDPGRLVGMFRREEAVKAYHHALGSRTDHQLIRARLDQRTHPGAGYYDFRVPPGSIADGRAVRDVTWPEGSTLVSVRRERQVIVPVGDTVLQAGDVVTAFGSESSRELMIERLNAGADEPTAEIPVLLVEELADPDGIGAVDGPGPTIGGPDQPGDER